MTLPITKNIYCLTSSSDEEGEIKSTKIPFNKSFLKHSLHPSFHSLIGYNSIPLPINYINAAAGNNTISSRLKKEIKNDHPILKVLDHKIESDRKYFNKNRFTLLGEAEEYLGDSREIVEYIRYITDCEEIDENTHTITITDKMINFLPCKTAFISFSYKNNKLSFTDILFSRILFYDYLDLCMAYKLERDNKSEIRKYQLKVGNDLFNMFISSNTSYIDNRYTERRRLYGNNIDKGGNIKLVLNDNNSNTPPYKIVEHSFPLNFSITINQILNRIFKYIINNKLEGDYVINEGNIYEINKKGESILYKGKDYKDFH
ncbi:hypothetical protein NUSPORA_02836 [Nucleospora cyclopteri]